MNTLLLHTTSQPSPAIHADSHVSFIPTLSLRRALHPLTHTIFFLNHYYYWRDEWEIFANSIKLMDISFHKVLIYSIV